MTVLDMLAGMGSSPGHWPLCIWPLGARHLQLVTCGLCSLSLVLSDTTCVWSLLSGDSGQCRKSNPRIALCLIRQDQLVCFDMTVPQVSSRQNERQASSDSSKPEWVRQQWASGWWWKARAPWVPPVMPFSATAFHLSGPKLGERKLNQNAAFEHLPPHILQMKIQRPREFGWLA